MWLVLNKGFLSIVKKEGGYVVRSRDKDHLKEYFPKFEIETDTGTDYQFRVRLTKSQLEHFFRELPDEIKYSNFKDSIHDSKLKSFASHIWQLGWNIFSL